MPLFDWKDTYSVGVEEIDNQHQKIFTLINTFFDLMKTSQVKSELAPIISKLSEYAAYHFATEDKYFQLYQYPERESHNKLHQIYEQKMSQFFQDSDNPLLPFSLLDFLSDWWINHIITVDQRYETCFRANGLH